MNNIEHVFLLTYRSVLKELSSSMSAATMNQSMYLSKVEMGETPGDSFSLDGLLPVLLFSDHSAKIVSSGMLFAASSD